MIKKLIVSIVLITFVFNVHLTAHVQAKDPNISDCYGENAADCSDEGSPNEINEDETEAISESSNSGSVLFEFVKMFFALLLVLALIYLLLKFLNKRNKLFQQVKALENLGGISVGPNKSIQIVRIGSKLYLIGVGDNVEMLHEITDEEIKNDILQGSKDEKNFQASALFSSFFQSKSNTDSSSSSFKTLFSNELDKLKRNRGKLIKQRKQKDNQDE